MKLKRTLIASILVSCGLLAPVRADDGMWPGAEYDPAIPTPKSFLGYPLGERHTPHYLVERYLSAVADASDRVALRVIGQSYQGRSQYHVILTAPENMTRLEEIRQANLRLADRERPPSERESDAIITGNPAIVLLSYTIHGDEGSGTEAALRTVYQLAAGTDQTTVDILKSVVTIVDPVQNPDGHDRFVHFVNDAVVTEPNPDPDAAEHQQHWPEGRVNAYHFDLNRDWFLLTQIESRNRMRHYLLWLPQVAVDLHEMGSNATYFFAPPMVPLNHNIPESTRRWWEIYGQANAAAFDRFGWTYYTRESFDEFYPGYGGSFPSYLGAVAMTYEQASAGSRAVERKDGTLLTLRDAVWHHFTTSMATLQVTAERREERLRDFHRFFVDLARADSEDEVREYLIPPGDPARLLKLTQTLQMIGARVYSARADFRTRRAYDYFSRKTVDVDLPAGTLIVPVAQTAGAAVRAILEPDSPLDEQFLKEERQRIDRNESSRFYDVTAWSLPLTYGLQAYWSPTRSPVDRELISDVDTVIVDRGAIPRARVAYLIPPSTNANLALVGRLLQEDFRLRVARKGFTLDGREFGPGTVVLRIDRNPETLHERISELTIATGGFVVAADTSYTADGIDLGSNNILALKKPRIALVGDRPTTGYAFGAIRYLFEQRYKLRYTHLPASRLSRIDLSKYNVLILPDSGRAGGRGYRSILGTEGLEKLRIWVQEGGVLICIQGATEFAADDRVRLSQAAKYRQRRQERQDDQDPYGGQPSPAPGETNESQQKGQEEQEEAPEVERLLRTPGAILRVDLDERSFLAWGYSGFVSALVSSKNIYVPIREEQGRVGGRYANASEMVLSGFVWPEMEELLAGKAYAWHEEVGSGQVICFAEDPTFRASYDGLDRLFLNAVFYGLAFSE